MPFEIVRNDITRMKVDAIVNAAKNSLMGGGGVDGAIHKAAGPELLEECRTLGGCPTGEAKITKGYNLPAKYVIHTVGPVWQGGGYHERELLTACYANSLKLAAEYECETVAFPMISAGAYGYPKEEAMEVAVGAISHFLMDHDMTVYLVVFGHDSFAAGRKLFRDVQEFIDDVYADAHIDRGRERERRRYWQRIQAEANMRAEEKVMAFNSLSVCGEEIGASKDAAPARRPEPCTEGTPDWDEILKRKDEGFSEALLRMIEERGMKDSECYRKANIDRKLFSKIRSNPDYRPTKPTACAFAVALELNLRETQELLNKAGLALTRSNLFDIVVEYFIRDRNYNIWEINEVLFEHDLPLLGSGGSVA